MIKQERSRRRKKEKEKRQREGQNNIRNPFPPSVGLRACARLSERQTHGRNATPIISPSPSLSPRLSVPHPPLPFPLVFLLDVPAVEPLFLLTPFPLPPSPPAPPPWPASSPPSSESAHSSPSPPPPPPPPPFELGPSSSGGGCILPDETQILPASDFTKGRTTHPHNNHIKTRISILGTTAMHPRSLSPTHSLHSCFWQRRGKREKGGSGFKEKGSRRP